MEGLSGVQKQNPRLRMHATPPPTAIPRTCYSTRSLFDTIRRPLTPGFPLRELPLHMPHDLTVIHRNGGQIGEEGDRGEVGAKPRHSSTAVSSRAIQTVSSRHHRWHLQSRRSEGRSEAIFIIFGLKLQFLALNCRIYRY